MGSSECSRATGAAYIGGSGTCIIAAELTERRCYAIDQGSGSPPLLGESSEPVTVSEHAERVAETRADYVPLDALAELMVDEQSDGELNDDQWDKANRAALAGFCQVSGAKVRIL